MNPVVLVIFILLTADFTLVLARLMARDRNAVLRDDQYLLRCRAE
jgi:hypothetical protein